jgi:hypothetical protein
MLQMGTSELMAWTGMRWPWPPSGELLATWWASDDDRSNRTFVKGRHSTGLQVPIVAAVVQKYY